MYEKTVEVDLQITLASLWQYLINIISTYIYTS